MTLKKGKKSVYIYVAGVLKTRSNLAAKSKVQLLPLAFGSSCTDGEL